MDFYSFLVTYLPIVVSLAAFFLSFYSGRKSHSASVYFEIDKQYGDLLKIALENPELRDFSRTSEYIKEDKSSSFYIRYNLYAYMVWNTLETIFDQNSKKTAAKKIKLNTWLPVIKEENKIHYCWFKHNIHLFKPAFSDFVINELNNLQIKRATANDLNVIYAHYVQQFPDSERKSIAQLKHLLQSDSYQFYIAYHNYLPKNENVIGYAFVLADDVNKSIWIDYLAVIKGFRSAGYGTTIVNKIIDDIGHGEYNTFIEVEIPATNDPDSEERRRMRFYEKLNCLVLPYDYLLPTADGSLKMQLYCRPYNKAGILFKGNIQAVIANAQGKIHTDLPNAAEVLAANIAAVDRDFHYDEQ